MIWDVLDWLLTNPHITHNWVNWYKLRCWVIEIFNLPRQPIQDQDESCIDFVYSLIESND
jgi:hypothetical protein